MVVKTVKIYCKICIMCIDDSNYNELYRTFSFHGKYAFKDFYPICKNKYILIIRYQSVLFLGVI